MRLTPEEQNEIIKQFVVDTTPELDPALLPGQFAMPVQTINYPNVVTKKQAVENLIKLDHNWAEGLSIGILQDETAKQTFHGHEVSREVAEKITLEMRYLEDKVLRAENSSLGLFRTLEATNAAVEGLTDELNSAQKLMGWAGIVGITVGGIMGVIGSKLFL